MFLVLEDDGCVHTYTSPDEAAQAIEALDVEGTVWKAYDDEARPYRVEWIKPNSYGKTFGFLTSMGNGEYRFVVAGPAEPVGLAEMLGEARGVFPETERENVRNLQRRLAGR
jgi:hypothetical protein